MNSKKISREKIKSRMLKQAAQLWGYQESEVEAFDPLVGLLVGACATELEKISHEIHSSHAKVLSRLAKLMTPDVVTGPQPAYGLLNVRCIEAESVIRPIEEVIFKKRIATKLDSEKPFKEIHFSPTATFKIIDGQVRYLASQNTLFKVNRATRKEVEAEAVLGRELPLSHLWIGLELNDKITSLENIAFCFDWKIESDKEALYQLLPFSKWYLEEQEIEVKTGIFAVDENEEHEAIQDFYDEFDLTKKIEKTVNNFCYNQFLSIQKMPELEEDVKLVKYKKNYPKSFEDVFDEGDLKNIKDELIWLKVSFPHSFPLEAISNVYCSINTIPVVNRQLNKLTYRLQQNINIVPLNTGDNFLNIRRIQDSEGNDYEEASPLTRLKNYKAMTYSLRQGNVGRYDERNAFETVSYLIDLLRDESAAFSALDRDWLMSEVKNLNQTIARLEQKTQDRSKLEPLSYLVIKPITLGDTVYLQFWSTNGILANKIPAGSLLENHSCVDVNKDGIELVAMTRGGRDKLNVAESLYAYKEAVMTRGRVVTAEDIKSVCWAKLGKRIEEVEVKKGVAVNPQPKSGLVRTIDVFLTPSNQYPLTQEEWGGMTKELRLYLEQQATITYPFRIILKEIETEKIST